MADFRQMQAGGDALSSVGNAIGSLTSGLFGGSTSGSGSVTSNASGTRTSKLVLDQAAIDKLIADVLGAEGGLADIFSQEKATGLYNTSAAKKETGNLLASIVGELAKLTGEQVTTEESSGTQESSTNTKESGLFDFLGF